MTSNPDVTGPTAKPALISAGFSVVIAMDTDRFYLIKVVKEADEADFVYDDEEQPAGVASHPLHHGHHHTETKRVLNRLSRITGHVEAIKRMIEDAGFSRVSVTNLSGGIAAIHHGWAI